MPISWFIEQSGVNLEVELGKYEWAFTGDIDRIFVVGYDGNDHIDLCEIQDNASVFGLDGDDHILGGPGTDILISGRFGFQISFGHRGHGHDDGHDGYGHRRHGYDNDDHDDFCFGNDDNDNDNWGHGQDNDWGRGNNYNFWSFR